MPHEFNSGVNKFIPGHLYVGMIYPAGAAHPRFDGLKFGSGLLQVGIEGRTLVLGILQDLLGHRTARERLPVADDIVAHLIEQSRAREDSLAHLLARREQCADRAHRAPQLAFGLAESGPGALRVETDEQVTLFHILGFLVKDLGDDARRVGIHRDEIAGDECIVGY